MVWEPFALAVVFGLLISAGIYFIVMWPQVAPDDDLPEATALAGEPAAEAAPAATRAEAEAAPAEPTAP